MSLKDWMLGRMNRVITRADLPPREPSLRMAGNVADVQRHNAGRAAPARPAPDSSISAPIVRSSARSARSSSASWPPSCGCTWPSRSTTASC